MRFTDIVASDLPEIQERSGAIGIRAVYLAPTVPLYFSSADSEKLRWAAKKAPLLIRSARLEPDTAFLREVAANNKILEIPLDGLMRSRGAQRAALIGRLRQFLALSIKYRADFMLCTRAQSVYDLRTPHELMAVGQLLGLTRAQAERAISAVPDSLMEAIERSHQH